MKKFVLATALAVSFAAPSMAQPKAGDKVRFKAEQAGNALVVIAIEPAN